RLCPVPAHVAVRHVPPGDVLAVLDRNDVTDDPGRHELVQLLEEGRVTEHVRDVQALARSAGDVDEIAAGKGAGGERLLQQDVKASLERALAVVVVLRVGRGDDGDV